MRRRSCSTATTLALGAAALLLGGCAATPGGDGAEAIDPAPALESSAAASRLTGSDNGLEIRKWVIQGDPAVVTAAMARHTAEADLPPGVQRELQQNGLVWARLPAADLDALLADLGGSPVNLKGWHGRILTWRSIHERPLGRGRATLAIDGRIRQLAGGRVALMARAWAVPLEDGPRFQVQLAPVHERATGGPDLRRLLGQEPAPPTPLTSLVLELDLQAGSAYLLTADLPQVPWTGTAAHEDETAPAAGPSPHAERAPRGPEVFAPPTLGELLLRPPDGGSTRGVLVFVPRIPPGLFPPELLARRPAAVD